MNEFGKYLQKLIREKGIEQKQLANYLGVTRASISKYCNGLSLPRKIKVELMETYFGINDGRLLELWKTAKEYNEPTEKPVSHEQQVLDAWKRGDRTPEEVAEITGLSMNVIRRYLPID